LKGLTSGVVPGAAAVAKSPAVPISPRQIVSVSWRGAQPLSELCAVAIMAKASVAGAVKTRLVPPLTHQEAAAFNTCCLIDIAANIIAAAEREPIQAFVAYSPPGSARFFAEHLPDLRLIPPKEPTIGRSLVHAAQDLFAAGYGSVCLVNADSPTLPTRVLAEAVRRLRLPGDRVVLGPAADGGYYLIGLKQFHSRLFEDIDWSTERVFRQTMARAGEIGLPVAVLPEWYDVDDDQSLAILVRELLRGSGAPTAYEGGYPAPRTAAFLRELAATNGALKRFFEYSMAEEAPQPGQRSGR
jgi:rSAM/selenodomain-associated transferase 1